MEYLSELIWLSLWPVVIYLGYKISIKNDWIDDICKHMIVDDDERFLTLTDNVEFRYKVDNLYSKEHDRGIRYDDPSVNVDWGGLLNGIEPVLIEKDQIGPTLENSNNQFVYEGDK